MHPIGLASCALFLSFLLANLHGAFAFSPTRLLATYDLYSGRHSACPPSLSYDRITSDRLVLPATSIKAGSHVCTGTGGKRIEEGSSLQSHGLVLPSLVANPDVSFYAGVETDTRICGPWAFNASTISWHIINNRDQDIFDYQTEVTIQPGAVYVIYTHFSDLCVYRTKVEPPRRETQPEAPDRNGVAVLATPEMDATAEPEPEDDPSPACFPGDAIVDVDGRGLVRMDELQMGDRVLASENGIYSQVYAFSHRDIRAYSSFVVIRTSSGKSLSLSPGHLLYLDGIPKTAGQARVQHSVVTASGAKEQIISIERRYKRGLFNPHTLSGTIVVNHILATTWTSALSPVVATSLLSPLRMLYKCSSFWAMDTWLGLIDTIIDRLRACAPCLRKFTRWSITQFSGVIFS